MEVDTEGLTEDAYKVGEFAGNVTLLVEAQASCHRPAASLPACSVIRARQIAVCVTQEDGFLHSILVGEGKKVPVGTPVALMAELQESLPQLDQYKVPVSNTYEGSATGSPVRTLVWQSYLKSDAGGSGGGCG